MERRKRGDNNGERLELKLLQLLQVRNPQTTEELAKMAGEELFMSEEEVIDVIMRMEREGKIALKSRSVAIPGSLSAHSLVKKTYWYWMTIIFLVLTNLAVVLIPDNCYPFVYLRYVLGTLFVLWFPGYGLVKALFPVKGNARDDLVWRITLSIGLSIAVVSVVGLLLNYTSWGVRLIPFVVGLDILTLFFATVGVLREFKDS